MNNKSEEQEGEGKNREVWKDSNKVRGEDDMTESSNDNSGLMTIREDTPREEEPIPDETLTDDEGPTKTND